MTLTKGGGGGRWLECKAREHEMMARDCVGLCGGVVVVGNGKSILKLLRLKYLWVSKY